MSEPRPQSRAGPLGCLGAGLLTLLGIMLLLPGLCALALAPTARGSISDAFGPLLELLGLGALGIVFIAYAIRLARRR
jgi:hypothetical protein